MRSALAALLSMAVLVGCGHTDVAQAVLRQPTAKTTNVDVYVVGQEVKQPYYDVALVQAIGFGDDANGADVVAALQKRAALLGCDAVIRVQIDQGYTRAHGSGVCVKFYTPGVISPRPEFAPRRPNPTPPKIAPTPTAVPEAAPATAPGGAW